MAIHCSCICCSLHISPASGSWFGYKTIKAEKFDHWEVHFLSVFTRFLRFEHIFQNLCQYSSLRNSAKQKNKVERGAVDHLSEVNQQLLESMSFFQESQMSCMRSGEYQAMAQPCSEEPQPSWQSHLTKCQKESYLQDSLSQQSSATSGPNFGSKDHDNLLEAVLKVIDFQFSSKHEHHSINWESMLIARRLVLILIFTLIPYPTLRNILILIMCVIMILHSAYANPYASNFVNKCDVISLLILTSLCLINSLVAFSYETNAHLQGYLRHFPEVFSSAETLLLDVLPGAILFMIATVFVIRLLVFLCTLIFKAIQLLVVKCQGEEVELDEDRYRLIES